MNPVPVRDDDAELFCGIQKSVQRARLASDREKVKELEEQLKGKIYELYPEVSGRNVRFDASSRKIFVWEQLHS